MEVLKKILLPVDSLEYDIIIITSLYLINKQSMYILGVQECNTIPFPPPQDEYISYVCPLPTTAEEYVRYT